jgi:O-acetyl-ADP-ribose deacetylase (regulator of RNase III)
MKKPHETSIISTRTVEKDLKTLFGREDNLLADRDQDEPEPTINLTEALKIFDDLRAGTQKSSRQLHEQKWSHPSVLALNDPDPINAIIHRARGLVLDAMERGWTGPPYNPFALAEMRGIQLLPTEDVIDARTRSSSGGRFTIEFNPQRPAARMRYSIAHELGHILFPDCAAETRNRATHQQMKEDDWQLESLCNMAAAEILMPFGTLQEEMSIRPSVDRILDLRRKYRVSCEAVVNRLVRVSAHPCCAFLARLDAAASRYFVEYHISSSALRGESPLYRGYLLPRSSKASACKAIGATDREDAKWIASGKTWFIEYLGISPNSGEANPRVLALAFPPPSESLTIEDSLHVVKGDATEPYGAEQKFLLQVVNDQAMVWGGGFAKQARKKWPQAQADFAKWSCGRRNLKLGNIHSVKVRADLTLVSLVAQHGFGKATSGPRLRYGALFSALERVAEDAKAQSATVHMPRIGAGEAGGNWNVIEGIVRETLVSRGIEITIYDLPSRSGSLPQQSSFEFPRELVDEVM